MIDVMMEIWKSTDEQWQRIENYIPDKAAAPNFASEVTRGLFVFIDQPSANSASSAVYNLGDFAVME